MHIDPHDTHKAAFVTDSGLFEWKRMPFGLRNSPNSFQRLMELVLSGLKALQVGVYLDDIIIASDGSIEDHLKKLKIVFERLEKHGLKLKPSKCKFLKEKINYLGFTVAKGEVFPDGRNIKNVEDFQVPKNKKQVRAFLGLTGFYRKFIANYAQKALPLTDLTKQEIKFQWSEETQEAFDILKKDLISSPCLRLPDFTRPFSVSCDASKLALGAVLSQEDDEGKSHPVAFASKKLKDSEVRYSTVEKEMLGAVFAVTHFKHYLYGKHFSIYCDQASLSHALKVQDPTSRIARWVMTLQQYDYKIIYKPGKQNVVADYLSRNVNSIQLTEMNFGTEEERLKRIRTHQENDVNCQKLKSDLENGTESVKTDLVFFQKAGVLYCTSTKTTNGKRWKGDRLVVPLTMVQEILSQNHDSRCVAHQGFQRTLERVKRGYWWIGMYKHIKNYIKSCPSCNERRGHQPNKLAALQRVPVTSRPGECIAIDAVGPLVQTYNGNKFILVLSDYFTRWPEAYAISDITSNTVSFILENYIADHGVPTRLISDRGTNFLSKSISEVYRRLGIEKHTSTSYHPQSDGIVERLNGTIINSLSHLVNDTQVDWDRHLPFALLAHRTACHATTGESPAYLLYGRDLQLPGDILNCRARISYADNPEYSEDLAYRMRKTFEVVHRNLVNSAERQEEQRKKIAVDKKLKVGDLVYLYTPKVGRGTSKKLTKQNTGPYRILEKLTPVNYKVGSLRKVQETQIVHVDRLSKCEERIIFPGLKEEEEAPNKEDGERVSEEEESEEQQEDLPVMSRGPHRIREKTGNENKTTRKYVKKVYIPTRTYELRTRD